MTDAVFYTDVASVATNLRRLCDVSPLLSDLSDTIQTYIDDNSALLALTLTTAQHNFLLGALTGLVVATETDLNCYPMGLLTVVYFDIDGVQVFP